MAESKSTMVIIPLNGNSYATLRIQCKIALMREGLWIIEDGTEVVPGVDGGERYAKFAGRRDHALANLILSVQPTYYTC